MGIRSNLYLTNTSECSWLNSKMLYENYDINTACFGSQKCFLLLKSQTTEYTLAKQISCETYIPYGGEKGAALL